MARKGSLLLQEPLRSTRFLCFSPVAVNESAWEEKCYIMNTENPQCKVTEFDPPTHIQIQRHNSLKIITDSSVSKYFRVFQRLAD
jgi:hypothetical protein